MSSRGGCPARGCAWAGAWAVQAPCLDAPVLHPRFPQPIPCTRDSIVGLSAMSDALSMLLGLTIMVSIKFFRVPLARGFPEY